MRFLLQEIVDSILNDPGPVFEFTIPGRPIGKQRPRCRLLKTGKLCFYPDPKSAEYENDVAVAFLEARGNRRDRWPLDAPLYFVMLRICYGRGSGKGRRSDPSNVACAVQDGLNGKAWNDDCHVNTWPAPGDDKSDRCEVWIKAMARAK
jgi:Holliday junction resolvase RusA-like endonuclease